MNLTLLQASEKAESQTSTENPRIGSKGNQNDTNKVSMDLLKKKRINLVKERLEKQSRIYSPQKAAKRESSLNCAKINKVSGKTLHSE